MILEIVGFIWSLPATIVGCLVWCACGGHIKAVRYYRLRWCFIPRSRWFLPGKFIGFNLGAFMFLVDEQLAQIPQLWVHEDEHRRQNWILGPFRFIYWPLEHLVSLVLTGDIYTYSQCEMLARMTQLMQIKRFNKFKTF